MLAKNITKYELEEVASKVSVGLPYDPYPSGGGLRVRFVPVRDEEFKKEHGYYKFQRQSAGAFNEDRKVWALCWHGYRDVFRASFKIAPAARFYTALAKRAGIKFYDAHNFESCFEETASINIGSQFRPVYASDACFCREV